MPQNINVPLAGDAAAIQKYADEVEALKKKVRRLDHDAVHDPHQQAPAAMLLPVLSRSQPFLRADSVDHQLSQYSQHGRQQADEGGGGLQSITEWCTPNSESITSATGAS